MNKTSAQYLIGVDGGGTGCRAVIALPDATVLGRGKAGPANATTDILGAAANVRLAIDAAISDAGLSVDASACATHIGLAGVLDQQTEERLAGTLMLPECRITDDRAITVEGALAGRHGIVLGIGTGTLIAAQRGGPLQGLNGWGFQISDQAAGAWLGLGLLRQTVLCHDGFEPHSPLTETVLEASGGPFGLVALVQGAGPGDYATHAPAIFAAAQAGDRHGLALVQAGAAYLARALEVLAFRDTDVLCLTGGVGPHYAPYLPGYAQARITEAKGTALDGALRLALAMT